MKKLMLLGGSRYLLPVIEAAHELGLFVVTCDYLPNNIAHQYSDKYINISIVEKDEILNAAKKEKIDGIMSFACDPGVVTAAYVAEQMGLPFQCSYKSAQILQDKGLFREFLSSNGFNVPKAKRYKNKKEPFKDIDYFNWPIIVKPVDSAGSKGVTRVDKIEELEAAIEKAVLDSRDGAFIVEDFLIFDGYHSSADPFTVNGELKFVSYSDQLFDKEADNPYTPAYIIWPSTMKNHNQDYLTKETQRLMNLLGVKTGIYNIETCVGQNGKPYLMEVSPRGGGCKIAELQRLAYGIDLIKNEVMKAVGMPVGEIYQTALSNCWCEMVLHAKPSQTGIFKSIEIREDVLNDNVRIIDLSVKPGDIVKPFTGANMSLGDIFLECKNREELEQLLASQDDWLTICLE